MVLDLILTTTIFGVPTVLLSPDTGLLMSSWQPWSSCGFFFFYFLIVLRQRKLEITPIKVKAMQRDTVSLSPSFRALSSYVLLLLSLPGHAEEEGNKPCFITCFYMIDPSRAISFSRNTSTFWHHQPA